MKRCIGGIAASLIATGAICHAADAPAPGDDPVFIAKAARAIDGHVATWYRKQKLPVPAVTVHFEGRPVTVTGSPGFGDSR